MTESIDFQFKVIVVGSPFVGKSSMIKQFVDKQFQANYQPTIGVDFHYKTMKLSQGGKEYKIQLQLWDISGGEKTSILSRSFYKNSVGCIVVGDITKEDVIQDVKYWSDRVRQQVNFMESDQRLPICVLFNKCDLNEDKYKSNQFQQQVLQTLGNDQNNQISAKTGLNVEQMVIQLAQKSLETMLGLGIPKRQTFADQLLVSDNKKKCC